MMTNSSRNDSKFISVRNSQNYDRIVVTVNMWMLSMFEYNVHKTFYHVLLITTDIPT